MEAQVTKLQQLILNHDIHSFQPTMRSRAALLIHKHAHQPSHRIAPSRPAQWLLLSSTTTPPTNHNHATALQRRSFTIQSTPTSSSDPLTSPATTTAHTLATTGSSTPDSTFTTHGPSSSLLTITLSASQPLHTRLGSLLALSGSPPNITSSLSPLPILKRAALGIPFIYQRITATSPTTLLLTPRGTQKSFVVLSLDGRIDWRVLRRGAIAAWSGSGSSLTIKPSFSSAAAGIGNLGSQTITGRGLIAVTARGGGYELRLRDGEETLIHPSNVVAYSIGLTKPEAYRLSHSRLRLTVPNIGSLLPETKFLRAVRESRTWKVVGDGLWWVRRLLRTVVWGERVYLRFRGPGTVVVQGRSAGVMNAMRDSYEGREVGEWADSPAGSVERGLTSALRQQTGGRLRTGEKREGGQPSGAGQTLGETKKEGQMNYASVGKDGQIAWTKD